MNRTMQLTALLTILPLLTVSISMSANNAYGASIICGVQLCSDYPGGKSKFEEDKILGYGYSVKSNSVIDPTMMMKIHDEKIKHAMKIADCIENMMMDEMMMGDEMMMDEMMMGDEMMMDEMMMGDEMMMDEMMMGDEMMMDEMMMGDEMMMDEMMMGDEMMMDEMMMGDEMMMDDEMMMKMKMMMGDEMMMDDEMMMKMKMMMGDEMMMDDEMMMKMKMMMGDEMMMDEMMMGDEMMMDDEMMMKMMDDEMMMKMMDDEMMMKMMDDEMMMKMKMMMGDEMMMDDEMMMKMMDDEIMMKMMDDEIMMKKMMMDQEFDCETYKMKYADKMHKKDSMHDDKMHKKDSMHDDKMRDHHDDEMKGMDHKKKVYLSRANVAAEIPLHEGYYNGDNVYYIITDASEQSHVDTISTNQNWNVAYAPLLANAPESALSKTYMFVNGIDGDGVHGYQSEVFTTIPGQDNYSPLKSHVHVIWNDGVLPTLLTSEDDIETAATQNKVTLIPLDVVINMPFIMWPNGQLQINENIITDHLAYGGGQITDIDLDSMTVTFIAHRGWGPDGSTIYYIVTDAIPSGPAEAMGVPHTPATASLLVNPAVVDLYQFKNGLTGTGPLGFQPGIGAAGFGDDNYSPMWRIFLIEWNDADHASLLMTKGDIDAMSESGKITVELAMPMDLTHIVNCPFIDPFQ